MVPVASVDLREETVRTLELRVEAEGDFGQTLELHDVHLGAQVFGQVAVDSKRDVAVGTLERPWL